jgi:hypothetical protein
VLISGTLALLYFGSLLDRRIHDRALAGWNARWRSTRYLWFVESNRARLAAVIAVFCVASSLLGLFLFGVRISACYELLSDSFTKCFVSILWSLNTEEQVLFVIVVCSLTLIVFWTAYKVYVTRSVYQANTESPGFALWIARRIRTSKALESVHKWFATQIVPLTSALVCLTSILWMGSRISFSVLDNGGWYCPMKPILYVRDESGQEVGHPDMLYDGETRVIEQKLEKFCESTGIWMSPSFSYEITLDFWNDFTDLRRDDQYWVVPARYVPVALRQARDSVGFFGLPFRRHIRAPWFVVVARIGSIMPKEFVLDSEVTNISPSEWGELYFYVNNVTLAVPYIYDAFYLRNPGIAKLTIKARRRPDAVEEIGDNPDM